MECGVQQGDGMWCAAREMECGVQQGDGMWCTASEMECGVQQGDGMWCAARQTLLLSISQYTVGSKVHSISQAIIFNSMSCTKILSTRLETELTLVSSSSTSF